MKNILILFLVFTAQLSYAQFRNTTWGMSKEEVKKIEASKLIFEQENLTYELSLNDSKGILIYEFPNKKLAKITYVFTPFVQNSDDRYDRTLLKKTINNIVSKYGNPSDTTNGVKVWKLENFFIRIESADVGREEEVKVIYSPNTLSQIDIL